MDDQQACQVPLLERMRRVPKEWREMREVGDCHHVNVPYGHLLHEAADQLERAHSEEFVVMLLGYLTAKLPELHAVEAPRLMSAWDDFKQEMGKRGGR